MDALRTTALANLMPRWIADREDAAIARSEAKDARARLKLVEERVARREAGMEHVYACELDDCFTCRAYARGDVDAAVDGNDLEQPGLPFGGIVRLAVAPERGYRLNARCPEQDCKGRLTEEVLDDDMKPTGTVNCYECGAIHPLDGSGEAIAWLEAEQRYEDEPAEGAPDEQAAAGGMAVELTIRPDNPLGVTAESLAMVRPGHRTRAKVEV